MSEPASFALIHGDVLEECPKHVASHSIDVIVTSPPYNVGAGYSHYKDALSSSEYLAWIRRWAMEMSRCLAHEGSLFINMGGRPSEPWKPWEVASVFRDWFTLQNDICWVKSLAIDEETRGHYKPVNSPRFLNATHEHIFHFTRNGTVALDRLAIGVPYRDKSNTDRWSGDDIHCRGNVWFIPYPTIRLRSKDRPHPATFPEKLPEMCMKLHGLDRIEKVMDPFMGLGTTALAAKALGKTCIGFEIDQEYVNFVRACVKAEANEPNRNQA